MFTDMTTESETRRSERPDAPPEVTWAQRTQAYEKLITRIREYDNVSFVEIETILKDQGIPVDGDLGIGVPNGTTNLYIWAGVSHEFHDLVDQLLCDYRLQAVPCTELTYMLDGSRGLKLPVADPRAAMRYKKPHWIPMVFKWHVNKDGIRLSI